MTLADKIVVLRAGRIEQVGAPLDLYRDPDNRFVAGFIGSPAMNFVEGVVRDGAVRADGFGGRLDIPVALPAEGTEVTVGLRPEHVALDPSGDTHTVELTEALGGVSYAYLTGDTGERLIVEERGDTRSDVGDRVSLTFEPRRLYLFDNASEARIR
ncbi:ABC transporter ATP-binding protein, partial [Rhodobacteraceae bacterium CCMM004]